MSKKSMLLALSVACAAMLAVPAAASAGQWTLTGGHQKFTTHTNTVTTLTTNQGETTECTSSSGEGTVEESGKGGSISLLFHGCKSSGTSCTTPGQSSGTIVTTAAVWKTLYLTHNSKEKPGIKIEGSGHGHLATFKCGFGLVTIEVYGSVIGEVEEKCGTSGKTFSLTFDSPEGHGKQRWTQETETGPVTDLTVVRNGSHRTGSQDGTGTITLTNSSTLHCA
jgi:hypothetical protein